MSIYTTSITTWFNTTNEEALRELVSKMDSAEVNVRYDGAVAISADGDLTQYFDGEDYAESFSVLQELLSEDTEFLAYVLHTSDMEAKVYRVRKHEVKHLEENALLRLFDLAE